MDTIIRILRTLISPCTQALIEVLLETSCTRMRVIITVQILVLEHSTVLMPPFASLIQLLHVDLFNATQATFPYVQERLLTVETTPKVY